MPTAPPEVRGNETGSLRPVLQAIPADAYANPTWKGLAYFGRDLLLYGLCVAALIHWANPLIVVPLWILTTLAVSALFVVGHDAAHQALFSHRWLNNVVGRVAMLPSWHLYSAWVFGHNRVHHGFTARQGYDFVWHPYTAAQYAAMSKPARLRHRVEWSFAGPGAYYLREVWWHKMIRWNAGGRWTKPVRRDRALVGGVILSAAGGLAGWSLGGGASVAATVWLVARVLVVPFLGFTFTIGSIVHIHHIAPDIKWLRRDEWTKFAAQMEGTTVLARRAGAQLLPALDHGPRPAPRGHAHPDVQPGEGDRRHRGRVPGQDHRPTLPDPGLRGQHQAVQALRLRRRPMAPLRRGRLSRSAPA